MEYKQEENYLAKRNAILWGQVDLYSTSLVAELSIWPHCLYRWPNMLLLI